MLKISYSSNRHVDCRTWWACPLCNATHCYFSVQQYKCEHCKYEPPMFALMGNDKTARIVFHLTGTDNMWG